MSDFLTRRKTVLWKEEVTPGTDPVPVVATNAVKMENPTYQSENEVIQTREVTRSLDASPDLAGGGRARLSGRIYLKGSGSEGVTLTMIPQRA